MSEPSTNINEAISPPAVPSDLSRSDLTEGERLALREAAARAVRSSGWLPGNRHSSKPRELFRSSSKRLAELERELYALRSGEPTSDLQWLYDNLRLVRTDVQDLHDASKALRKLPYVRTSSDEAIPRCIVLARALLTASDNRLNVPIFSTFVEAVQEVEPLRIAELGGMLPALKLALLERIAENGHKAVEVFRKQGTDAPSFDVGRLITSLRFIGEIEWKEILEQLSLVHQTLLLDPSGVYGRTEFQSREAYRLAIERIARHSDLSEIEVAKLAVSMAEQAHIERGMSEAQRGRLRHVGYYIVDDEGSKELLHRAAYRPSLGASIERLFRRYPDEVYIIGIEFVTLVTVVALTISIVRSHGGWGVIAGALLLILPATQAAVEVMNYLVTTVLTPRRLPKLDFSKAIDPSSATIVAIPTLLINEKQIRQLVDDLEVRYLVNRDANIFYALLTDLPDTAEPAMERDDRIDLAVSLIEGLNRKYEHEPYGGFYLFHRHRVFNPREGTWMGWERKRGKLLDLNQLLRGAFDPFPVKAGDLSVLPQIRYVLTLDSDTQLPRGSAQRMIGAIAHPLNRALIDPDLNIVTHGYGILQPRVGISVHSATRSRLASIYSGQTGFDIYSRAVSDVYQDLYGEGIFTGKGIYDVDALRQVLEHRFPRNALLSHDLIEGAYARAGLISDIEVIDDYPSHYSAYNRRKHRWLRGDWQIVRWIFNRVPDESRRLVRNPISLVSRWKIVDNLRRSLVEPATFSLLVAGWFFLPGGPRFWTCVTVALLFVPIYFRLIFALIRAAFAQNKSSALESLSDFGAAHISILLNIAFLCHQALVALDAIVRTIIRSTITHSRLLEWETATEAELGIRKRTPVDIYLDWIPVVALLLALALFLRPHAAPWALPFIIAWGCSRFISIWLNRSPHLSETELSPADRRFLRDIALRTWQYFAAFSNEKNHWLIPDNVQEEPYRIAERISPTNLGFLLNARQAAYEFGYITLSEFVDQTERTLETASRLPRYFGHFLNWYDTLTLEPLRPQFVSSVDSGNLLASLWSLKHGCIQLLQKPLVGSNVLDGLADYERTGAPSAVRSRRRSRLPAEHDPNVWMPRVLSAEPAPSSLPKMKTGSQISWGDAYAQRLEALRREAHAFMPWCLPEYESIRKLLASDPKSPLAAPTPRTGTAVYATIDAQLLALSVSSEHGPRLLSLIENLRRELSSCSERLQTLAGRLQAIAAGCDKLVREMEFTPLIEKNRRLLSVGFDVEAQQLSKSCYDLLASEARTAAFIAVARGQVAEEVWFRLGRQHTVCEGETVLVSWTGTMFEYLMPPIWMRSLPNTLLDRAARSAVRAQQAYGRSHRVPWGISEAAYSKTDTEGNYQYAAFGVPGLALNVARAGSLVVSPYSSCLALSIDPAGCVENLEKMRKKHWLTDYGFFESADFTPFPARRFFPRKYRLVRCWMAHHQGMSLTALCNALCDAPFQRWFHSEPLVQASELILQERPLRVRPITDSQPRRVLGFTRTVKGPAAKVRASA